MILALWLFVSPWMLSYTQMRLPVLNGDAVGFVVAAFSIAAMLKFTKWEEWINIVAGFWLIASRASPISLIEIKSRYSRAGIVSAPTWEAMPCPPSSC
ncbi:MAG: SPW repeat protein [Bradyrhizobium sp.]